MRGSPARRSPGSGETGRSAAGRGRAGPPRRCRQSGDPASGSGACRCGGSPSQTPSAGEALADPMPVLNSILSELPAQLDELALPIRIEFDQPGLGLLQRNAEPLEPEGVLGKLELGIVHRTARCLVRSFGLRPGAGTRRLVIGN